MSLNIRDLLPVFFCGLSIPLSLFMWLGNLTISKLFTQEFEGSAYAHTYVCAYVFMQIHIREAVFLI